MSVEGEQNEIEERFRKILVADHSQSQSSRWTMIIVVVLVVALVVFGTYYYMFKKKGAKDVKKMESKESATSSSRKSPEVVNEAPKLVISGGN